VRHDKRHHQDHGADAAKHGENIPVPMVTQQDRPSDDGREGHEPGERPPPERGLQESQGLGDEHGP